MICEEVMWAQRAQQLWLIKGDRNTKYFHTTVKACRNKNRIHAIFDDSGNWITDHNQMKLQAMNYFSTLCSSNCSISLDQIKEFIRDSGIPKLAPNQVDHISKPFTRMEIKTALFQMNGSKAPGPDGMPPIFFQHFWDTTGNDLIGMSQFAKMVWFGSTLMIRTDQINQSSIIDWIDCQFNKAIQQKDDLMESLFKQAIIIYWSIYTQRNQVIFQNAKKDPLEAIHRVVQVSQKMSMGINFHKDFPFFSLHDQNGNNRTPHAHGNCDQGRKDIFAACIKNTIPSTNKCWMRGVKKTIAKLQEDERWRRQKRRRRDGNARFAARRRRCREICGKETTTPIDLLLAESVACVRWL
ncbi:CNGC5-like protein [Senna tora]|uniref:CNGC5-like protein n=1 Tax=Senna tora TaxID=362788 RepID=A0A835CBR6_9FABA|nr:CNGC5-like protein [Senna tora]